MSRRPEIDDCETLLLTMSTSKKVQVFGKKGDPGVEVGLPISLDGCMLPRRKLNVPSLTYTTVAKKCGFFMVSQGGPQKTTWYDLWQGANAVWEICGRQLEQGFAVVGSKSQPFNWRMQGWVLIRHLFHRSWPLNRRGHVSAI